ncbi:hypothetical protein KX816_02325 [Sphingosinicellaceae bacterium]|nr:hypothetical protein KX816_02325 [Sphingosinicellaceae bacterium]
MASIEIGWAETGPISIFDVARQLGFDLNRYTLQPPEVKLSIRKLTVDFIIQQMRETWRASYDNDYLASQDFNRIANGVYVIAIGGGFAVNYECGPSEVMYIGRGRIANRLRSHLVNWIFDMSLSLRDVPFKFFMETVGDGRSPNAFKDFEHLMLKTFSEKFGEKPLVNKIHGREGHIVHRFSGPWKRPFDNRSGKCLWAIRPSKRNAWFKEFKDD